MRDYEDVKSGSSKRLFAVDQSWDSWHIMRTGTDYKSETDAA